MSPLSPRLVSSDTFLSKCSDFAADRAGVPGGAANVASHLLRQAIRRLVIVCISVMAAVVVLWLLATLLRGTLESEFRHLHQWVPPSSILIASAFMIALARSRRVPPASLVRVGLVYEVIVSYGIVASGYFHAFAGMDPAQFNSDRIGVSHVAIWMVFFTILVPARPREALVALILSGTAVPLIYAAEIRGGTAPALPAVAFFTVFVLPYAATIAFAYVAARVVHRLGVEVRRAQELGSYRLEGLLGRGGMGEVWRASHHTLARPAAIKVIRRGALGHDPATVEIAVKRFQREAQVIASLQSPHTVALYDFGTTDDGAVYYVMELLDGVDLEQLVRRYGPLPAERVVHVLTQACASLEEAHRHGIVHRDIKPANIYLCRRALEHDVVKLLDFGLAHQHAPVEALEATRLTLADLVAGTPAYMAPEIALGRREVDARADIYALGCVAFWLLTGRVVFEADTPNALIVAHVKDEPPRPSAFSEFPIPAPLETLVLECLAKNPAERPQSAADAAARLGTVPLVRPWTRELAAHWWDTHRPASPAATSEGLREGDTRLR